MMRAIIHKIKSILGMKRQEQVKPGSRPSKPVEDSTVEIDGNLKKQLWAVGGGKGGVGKSLITLMLGTTLTRWGKKVVIVDADLGGSNINLLVGIRNPAYTLEDFMYKRTENIQDVALDTPVDNLKVVCGAGDILGMANPKSSQKARLFNSFLELEADIILLDLGAGTSYATLDFFLFASRKLIVLSPQTTAIQNAYGFLKSCLYRKLTLDYRDDPQCLELIEKAIATDDKSINSVEDLVSSFKELGDGKHQDLCSRINEMDVSLVVNMVRENKDIQLGRSMIDVASKYLSISPEYMGFIEYSSMLDKSVNRMASLISDGSDLMTKIGFYDLANKVIKKIYREERKCVGV